jgi:hypothetical protein
MDTGLSVTAGQWWRFSQYKLEDGYIKPARGARLMTYDPWRTYWETRGERSSVAPPYVSLLDLLRIFKFREISRVPWSGAADLLTPEATEGLLAWCKRYGLLGILPHRALVVTLAPRWEEWSTRRRKSDGRLWRVQRQYVRSSQEWLGNFSKRPIPIPAGKLEGALVPEPIVPENWPQPNVLLQGLTHPSWEREVLGKTWHKFFPTVSRQEAETFRYPLPLSKEFWHLYAEPFEEFLWTVIAFRDAFLRLDKSRQDRRRMAEGKATLHALLGPVSFTLEPQSGGQFRQRWAAMSLLSSFSMMAFLDLAGDRRLRVCRKCERPFVSRAWQARYCRRTCRLTAQKRVNRANRRRKKEMEAAQPGSRS